MSARRGGSRRQPGSDGPGDGRSLVVVSGLSGAGKSSALHALEDLGYYCVDNLPPPLIGTFVELCDRVVPAVSKVAVVVDVRTRTFLDQLAPTFEELQSRHPESILIFLDADDSVLQQRFSETRRPHPLAATGDVTEAIRQERQRLEPVRALASRVIDTSRLNPHELRSVVRRQFGTVAGEGTEISVISFGFRDGLPENADLVFDVRFLPNPNYVPELKPLTGMDNAVQEYVESQPDTREFLRHLGELLEFLVPRYTHEGRAYLTVAIGCTGGQHRSVAIASRVAGLLEAQGHRVSLSHRDLPG